MFGWYRTLSRTLLLSSCGRKPARRSAPKSLSWRPNVDGLEERLQPATPTLGAAADFAVVGVNGGMVTINKSAIGGDVGLGPNVTSSFTKASVNGRLAADPSAFVDVNKGGKNITVSGGISKENLGQVAQDANDASAQYTAMPAINVFGNVTKSMTLSGVEGTTVVNLASVNYGAEDTLTLSGDADRVFVFNITGNFTFHNAKIVLAGGITADHVLFNFPTAGPQIEISGGQAVVNGTFLAPSRGVLDKNAAEFNGAIIAKSVTVRRDETFNFVSFAPPVQQPPASGDPASLMGRVTATSGQPLNDPPASVTLTGTDDQGNPVSQTTETDVDGYYYFEGLQPGTYEVNVVNYVVWDIDLGSVDGESNGSENGTSITGLALGFGNVGEEYNFMVSGLS